jgi:sugar (pentulose or hexulose) kinase
MLEAVAFRLALVYDLLAPAASSDHAIVASGGALQNSPAWLQIIADAIGRPITRSREQEATSRGVAVLALHALGTLADLAAATPALDEPVHPDAARHARYREAIARQVDLDRRV